MRDVALKVPLGLFALGGGGEGDDAGEPRIEQCGHALDDAALAGGVAALEDDDDPEPAVTHPVLELDHLALQPAQLLLVLLARKRGRLSGLLLGDGHGYDDSTFCFRPLSTELNVLRIAPPIIGPTIGASKPRGSKPWVMRLPDPLGAIEARIAIFVPGRAVLSSSNERPSS